MHNRINSSKCLEELEYAACAENTMSIYYRYLTFLIHNGKVKNHCSSLSETAEDHKKELLEYFKHLGVTDFSVRDECEAPLLDPERLSLIGTIDMGLKLTKDMIKVYKDLFKSDQQMEGKNFFKGLLIEKSREKKFLENEKKFHNKNRMSLVLANLFI